MEENQKVQERSVPTVNIGVRKTLEHDGVSYIEKTGITNILLLGVDINQGKTVYNARQGGQADFLLLLTFDENAKTISQLQIDRDTIEMVDALGVFGNDIGAIPMQICLAHGFGHTEAERCFNSAKSVSRMLSGQEIDYYISFNMDGIALLNNALGGVSVTLTDDFSHLDPSMTKGATLTLADQQAEFFVRGRMGIGEGTNASRMARQRLYLQSATSLLKLKLQTEEMNFIDSFLDQLQPVMYSNMSRSAMRNQAIAAYDYETFPAHSLEGTHAIDAQGFMSFKKDDDATKKWLLRTFFEQINE